MPKISVILTSYNLDKYIEESIESILRQTFEDFELIIWDDASTDCSWEIINSYTDDRIRAFRNDTNMLGIHGINQAISSIATGEFIAIHHSDDVWEPDKLEKQVAFLHANPQIGAVFSDALAIDDHGQSLSDRIHFYDTIFKQTNRSRFEWLRHFFYKGNALCHPSVLIRKKCYEDCGLYCLGMAQMADFEMWVRLCLQYDIHVLPEKLVRFRVRDNFGNASSGTLDHQIRTQFEFLRIFENFLTISSIDEMIKIFSEAQEYIINGDYDLGFIFAKMALVEHGGVKYKARELFGINQMQAIFSDPIRVAKVNDLYSFLPKDLASLTSQYDIWGFTAEQEKLHVEHENESLREELQQIRSSKSWKIARLIRQTRKAIFPPGRSFSAFIHRLISPLRWIIQKFIGRKDILLIQNSDLFDADWYLDQYPDVAEKKLEPTSHYLLLGGFEGRNPGPNFNSSAYLAQNPDVRIAKINPLVHYLKYGKGMRGALSVLSQDKDAMASASLINTIDSNIYSNNQEYRNLGENRWSEHFCEYQDHARDSGKFLAKLIAFYLPQFHPIPENDAWWGRGFTEWFNVSKAAPNFVGHYQPHMPGELGFYDLRVEEVQQRQIELARNYGVHGFCFHYYWFDGKRLLEKPLDQFIARKENKFPFCVCWANENWTRRWDGAEHDILIQQNYTLEGHKKLIGNIIELSQDKRYIRLNGKPIFIVYRVDLIPHIKGVAEMWREQFLKSTGEEVFLVAAQSFEIDDPRDYGFDAALEFPPHRVYIPEIDPNTVSILNPNFIGKLYDYNTTVKYSIQKKRPKYKLFRTVMPAWDNTPRKQDASFTFINAQLDSYKKWLSAMMGWTAKHLDVDEQFIFVNAWNEWGEGAYLEPDQKYGYAYLQATYEALKRIR